MKPIAVLLTLLALFVAPPAAFAEQPPAPPAWSFRASDVPVDPGFVFGTLPNGMRYVLRANQRPAGTVLVRLRIGSGSLQETDDERGLAHFIEHMAFNGTTHVREGEMVKLLEREGLAFGADTNAATGFENTTYKLDLPRNDPKLIDTALMLMRETASELTLAPAAVDRERGVILAEKRDGTTYALRETEDQWAFLTPDARYRERLPIGVAETLAAADSARLRAFYKRAYVPANAVLVVIGDIDPAAVAEAIHARFADWKPAPAPVEPSAGPVDLARAGLEEIYLDPALSERVTATRLGPWVEEPDTIAQRQTNLLRDIGYRIVNRRFEAMARAGDPPFRGAGFGTGDIFKAGRSTNLVVDSADGQWRKGLVAAATEWRRALQFGFTPAEVAEQVARIRAAQVNAAAAAETRSNSTLVNTVFALLDDEVVPTTPHSSLARFEAFAPQITPDAVLAALKADAAPLDKPLLRFQGRTAPDGGAAALRAAWTEAMAAPLAAPAAQQDAAFAYTEFGTPGTVVSDRVEPTLGIREIRFANGVRLNLKQTDLEAGRIRFALSLDGGSLLATKADPLATAMVTSLPLGGLGKHSLDQLDTLTAGRTVGFSIAPDGDVFAMNGTTVPADLEFQLDLLAAAITDPGYRPEGELRYRRNIANFFASKDATPAGALGNALGGILSDNDPRFTLQPEAAFEAQNFAHLRAVIGDRLAHGAIEIALVGDFNSDTAIAAVARTLGALPAREPEFAPRAEARIRSFTTDRSPRVVTHTGEADQALLRYTWPTVDDRDQAEVVRLDLLERIVQIELQEELRERLGKSYSPSASSSSSHIWPGYGTFALAASVDLADVDATRAAVRAVMERLIREPVEPDVLARARQPLIEAYQNALKGNGGWMALARRAQSEPERIARFERLRGLLEAVTPAELQATAARYLAPDKGVEVLARPAEKSAAGAG
jgi:zinc protease